MPLLVNNVGERFHVGFVEAFWDWEGFLMGWTLFFKHFIFLLVGGGVRHDVGVKSKGGLQVSERGRGRVVKVAFEIIGCGGYIRTGRLEDWSRYVAALWLLLETVMALWSLS